jgi:membrane associated rhomboid family serine protease
MSAGAGVNGTQWSAGEPARLTPWVGRLLALNAVILLLQQTIFTSDRLTALLQFDPALWAQRPWTLVTYIFLHANILHLAGNSLALFVFGPLVERRMGSAAFLVYYLYCGVAAAAFTVLLNGFIPQEAFIGASGAIIGVAYAFARIAPDTPLMLLLVPIPIKARWMIPLLAAYDLVGMLVLHDNVAHGAHLGGLAAGVVYFTLRNFGRTTDPMPIGTLRRRVPVATRGSGMLVDATSAQRMAPEAPSRPAQPDRGHEEANEIDRVLDKISATGIHSLTAEERSFLDAVARRRRDLPH